MKPVVYFRVDGSKKIGLGHLIRCVSLAHMLKDDFEIFFICKEIPTQLVKELKDQDFKSVKIDDENQFFSVLTKTDIVVLDGYDFDNEYQKKLISKGCKLVCIDDLHEQSYSADLIINHAPNVKPGSFKAPAHAMFALGSKFALIRPAFLKQSRVKRQVGKVNTILVCMGGTDYKNITLSALEVVSEIKTIKRIIVITGAAYVYADSLNPILVADRRIEHHNSVKEVDMLKYMVQSDLAITPASGILYEVLAVGLIAVIGMFVDNQKLFYKSFVREPNVFDAKNFEKSKIRSAVQKALVSDPEPVNPNKEAIADSGIRISRLFKQLSNSINLLLTRVRLADREITFKWASDPAIRNQSFTIHQITMDEHVEWFNAKLKDPNCWYYVADYNGKPAGSIRFDVDGLEAKISYLLDSGFHGKGFGPILLANGIEKFTQECKLDLKLISGSVLKSNIASIKSFERLGFEMDDRNDSFLFKKYI